VYVESVPAPPRAPVGAGAAGWSAGLWRPTRLNGWPAAAAPRLCHGDIEAPNLAALGDYIAKLHGAGMGLFPDPALEDHLRRVAGLPRRPKVQLVGPTGGPVSSGERSPADEAA